MLSSRSKWVWKQTYEWFFLRDVELHGHPSHHPMHIHIKINSLNLIQTLNIVKKCLMSQLCSPCSPVSPGLLLPSLLLWILLMPAGNQMSATTYRKSNWLGTYYLKQWKMNKPCALGSGFVAVANSSFLKRAPWGIGLGTVLGHLSKFTGLHPSPSFLFTHPLLISALPTVLHPSKPECSSLKCDYWFLISTFWNVFLHYEFEWKLCTMPPHPCIISAV